MHLTCWGSPSMPVIVSLHGRLLIKSLSRGWQCHEHPLSMTAQHMALAAPVAAGIDGMTLSRRARPASSALPVRPSFVCAARASRSALAWSL
jgi:hypothetical protein